MYNIDPVTQVVIKKYPHRAADIAQSFNWKQVECKDWLVKEIREIKIRNTFEKISRIYIIGGWYGQILVPQIRNLFPDISIRFYEIDKIAIEIAQKFYLKDFNDIKYYHEDATSIKFTGSKNLVINTSSEHMNNLNIHNCIYAVQSNNYYNVEDHVNCVDNPEQLTTINKFRKVWYHGEKEFAEYDRFMVIGRI